MTARTLVPSDLLSAASLLLAAITAMYATWYGDVKNACDVRVPMHDRQQPRAFVRDALWGKTVPVFVGSALFFAVLCPTAVTVIKDSWRALGAKHAHYDAVAACFLLVVLALAFLAVVNGLALVRLIAKLRQLQDPPS